MLHKLKNVLSIPEEKKPSMVSFQDSTKMSELAIIKYKMKSEFSCSTLDDKFRYGHKLQYTERR